MSEKFDENSGQPRPKRGVADVTDAVIADYLERKGHGIKKYGTALMSHNGRDALKDAYEESLDQTIYLKQRLLENERFYDLRDVLEQIMILDARENKKDSDYNVRDIFIYNALYIAKLAGLECGFRIDEAAPGWPVAYIELPEVGQVTWHMQGHGKKWDGHTTEEKYDRIRTFIKVDKY